MSAPSPVDRKVRTAEPLPSDKPKHSSQKKIDLAKDKVSRADKAARTSLSPPPAAAELHPRLESRVSAEKFGTKERNSGKGEKSDPMPHSSPLGIPKIESGHSIGREDSRNGTPHTPSALEQSYSKSEQTGEQLREVFVFLSEDLKVRISRDYFPAYAKKFTWIQCSKEHKKSQKDVLEKGVEEILRRISSALCFGISQFLNEKGESKEVYGLTTLLTDNPTARECIENTKNQLIILLWRKVFLYHLNPLPQRKIFVELEESIKTICSIFVGYQMQQVESLKKKSLLPPAPPSLEFANQPEWNLKEKEKEGRLAHIYTRGFDNEAINEVLYHSPNTINVMSSEIKKFSLTAFLESAKTLADSYMRELAPLLEDPVFEKYIDSPSTQNKKELKKLLKKREFTQILIKKVGEIRHSDWQANKEKLPFALLELAKRANWLIEQQKGEKIFRTTLEEMGNTINYTLLTETILRLARDLTTESTVVAPKIV